MPKPILISTKKGDAGESFLADGSKLPKDDLVFEVLGNIDELNSQIGLVVAQLRLTGIPQSSQEPQRQPPSSIVVAEKKSIIKNLENVQSNLYLLSGILAKAPKLSFSKAKLTKIEKLGNGLQEKMADGWTSKFLYPGGSIIGANLDVARSVCRRCERSIVSYSHFLERTNTKEKIRPVILQYINRLSDLLFILRCYINLQFGVAEKQFSKKLK